jgi:hypothetical protein
MKTNPLKEGAVTANSIGIGTVTRKMVRERAVELAGINGRTPQEASKADWEQAKSELTAGSSTHITTSIHPSTWPRSVPEAAASG